MRRLALAAAAVCLWAPVAEARPGDLDRSFSKDGKLGFNPYKLGGTVRGLALRDGRRPLLSVQAQRASEVAPTWVSVSARGRITHRALIPPPAFYAPLLAGGFGVTDNRPSWTRPAHYGLTSLGGRTLTPLAIDPGAEVIAIGVDRQRRVVLGGVVDFRARVWRFHPDGRPDTSFAGDGRAELDQIGIARLVVERDGRVVVADSTQVTALDASGNRLAGFRHGPLLPPRRDRSGYTRVSGIVSAPGGGFFVYGGGYYSERAWVMRLRADGRRDRRWGRDGYFTDRSVLQRASLSTATVDRHGRLLLAGSYLRRTYGFSAMIVRLTTRGRADRSFARRGRKVFKLANVAGVEIDSSDIGHVAVDDRGRIVVAGNVYDSDFIEREDYGNPYPAIARLKGS